MPRVYTTCMLTFQACKKARTATACCCAARPRPPARFQGSMRLTWCYRHWFLRIKRGAARLRRRRREGAGAQGKCSDNSGLHFAYCCHLRFQSGSDEAEMPGRGKGRAASCIGASARVKNRCLQRPYFPRKHPPGNGSESSNANLHRAADGRDSDLYSSTDKISERE